MSRKEAHEILKAHQEWRLEREEVLPPMPYTPEELTMAINVIIEELGKTCATCVNNIPGYLNTRTRKCAKFGFSIHDDFFCGAHQTQPTWE